MSRRIDLERHIRESYEIIREYEGILRLSDEPKEKKRAQLAIDEQKGYIGVYLKEYDSLCTFLKVEVPTDIAEIANSYSLQPRWQVPMSETTVKVFVSYSHNDVEYLRDDSLLGYLKGLEKENIEFWTDRNIHVGEAWNEVIAANIQDAPIALVLVSQGFLDSDYCQNIEIKSFLAQKSHLFPIILSPCEWRRYDWLSRRQFLPGGDETIEENYTNPGRRKRLFLEIRKQLRERIELIRQTTSKKTSGTTSGFT